MTTSQAAKAIGCSVGQVRTLVRAHKIHARKVQTPHGTYYYEIEPREVRRYACTKPGGWPRGVAR